MSDDEMRVKIAEVCGWRHGTWTKPFNGVEISYPDQWKDIQGQLHINLPDYLNDLNAMHAAEQTLGGGLLEGSPMLAYTKALHKATDGMGHLATARQRAEAFIQTIATVARNGADGRVTLLNQ